MNGTKGDKGEPGPPCPTKCSNAELKSNLTLSIIGATGDKGERVNTKQSSKKH
jgi:hypothetical protein